jgi:hypothetical protein
MAELVAAPRTTDSRTTDPGSGPRPTMARAGGARLSVFVIVIDGTIVNVALPTMVRELGATTSQLQWIVDAYTLVSPACSWPPAAWRSLRPQAGAGDRPGLVRHHLPAGRLLAVARTAHRGPGGHGHRRRADLPATLAILSNVFREPSEGQGHRHLGRSAASVAVGPVQEAGCWSTSGGGPCSS